MTASPTGMEIGRAGVGDFVAALEALGGGHGDGADPVVAQVLLHFERQLDVSTLALHGEIRP
jgi:cell division GTPase FtsZ